MRENLTTQEALAVQIGEDLGEFRKECALKTRIRNEAKKYLNTPVEKWPPIKFNWDILSTSQRFSIDGQSQEEFVENYPGGFFLGYVELAEIDKVLCHYSQRDVGELWTLGSPCRLAYLIVYLSEGRPISPPLVTPLNSGEVTLQAGHHRYAIAKAVNEHEIPIYVIPEHKTQLDNLIIVQWNEY